GFMAKLASADGACSWTKHWGNTTGDTFVYALAVDSSNNVYAAGDFDGTVNFGGGSVSGCCNTGQPNEIFAVKVNSSGSFQWQKWFGTNSNNTEVVRDIAVDGSG